MFSQNPHISPRDLEEKINTQVLLLDEFVLSPLFNCVVLAQPLDLTDLLLAEHQEYRALWARHYLAMDPPYVLAQAGDVWQKASELAALNEAAAAGEVLSLLPQGANAADTLYQETLRTRLKSGNAVHGGTWLVTIPRY